MLFRSGLFESGCPDFDAPLPDPIDGDEHGATALPDDTAQEPFEFSVDGVADGDYGVAAMLQFSDGVSDCEQPPASGDLMGCAEVTVEGGADVADIDLVLDTQIP